MKKATLTDIAELAGVDYPEPRALEDDRGAERGEFV